MKAITANPETIREVFSKRYVIPDFQRPYSWDNEQCEKLWDDIIDFFEMEKKEEEQYFLGNIVINLINPAPKDSWNVVDGQQRLTTLLLLIKALYFHAGTVKVLEECLKTKNPLTSELNNEPRVVSSVIDNDRKNLQNIILKGSDGVEECLLLSNYLLFNKKIDEWWVLKEQTADALNNFILTLLDRVVLLPIHCESVDHALTIFETINNRGMSLSDADIFKAKLYDNTIPENKKAFIADWNALENHDWLFRVLMHITRAQEGDTSKEIAMRSFFTSNAARLEDCAAIMISLKVINAINEEWDGSDEIKSLWGIMQTYTNYYWKFPLFVYLHKYCNLFEETEDFILPDDKKEEFLKLLETTVQYFFIKGVVHNSVNAVKDTVFRVCSSIEREGDYLSDYKLNISDNDKKNFKIFIETSQLGRYQRGIVLLSAYLNPGQDKNLFSSLFDKKYDIEHILPKKWNNYDLWTNETWSKQLNTLGNLIPLPKSLNIAARNEFFDKKKTVYENSNIQDALELCNIQEWTPETLEIKQKEKERRLLSYCNVQL